MKDMGQPPLFTCLVNKRLQGWGGGGWRDRIWPLYLHGKQALVVMGVDKGTYPFSQANKHWW